MVMIASRAVFRQSAKFTSRVARRGESTQAKAQQAASKATEKASEAASKASEKTTEAAANFQSKASEGLSRASATAGPAIAGAAQGVANALGKIGGRTGRFISFVESKIPPTIYYARVGLEMSKLVARGQQMSPPPMSTFQNFYSQLIKNPKSIVGPNPFSAVRNANGAQIAAAAVVAGEVLGFFTVGEIIGRMKVFGYRGETATHH